METPRKPFWRTAFQWTIAALTLALGLLMGAESAASYSTTGWFDIGFLEALTVVFGLTQTGIWLLGRKGEPGQNAREGYTAASSFLNVLGPLLPVFLQVVVTQLVPAATLTLPDAIGTALLILMAATTLAASFASAVLAFKAAGPARSEPAVTGLAGATAEAAV